MSTKFDFYPTFRDFNIMLAEDAAWQVVNNDVYNIDNMSDEELRQSIIDDVLAVTIWEKQTGDQAVFGMDVLCRYLTEEQKLRVESLIHQHEINPYFDITPTSIRIKDDRTLLQAAMDYAGVWYDGFDCPEGAFSLDRDAFHEAVEEFGGLDNLATALAMELGSTHHSTNTRN